MDGMQFLGRESWIQIAAIPVVCRWVVVAVVIVPDQRELHRGLLDLIRSQTVGDPFDVQKEAGDVVSQIEMQVVMRLVLQGHLVSHVCCCCCCLLPVDRACRGRVGVSSGAARAAARFGIIGFVHVDGGSIVIRYHHRDDDDVGVARYDGAVDKRRVHIKFGWLVGGCCVVGATAGFRVVSDHGLDVLPPQSHYVIASELRNSVWQVERSIQDGAVEGASGGQLAFTGHNSRAVIVFLVVVFFCDGLNARHVLEE
mmetsp:Transcript_21676/g.61719  ORF Transcript_21676/g.61719 Transcript_21676/m.61719 type:complete len:255 (-) Transcript_21676:1137-1901(-)